MSHRFAKAATCSAERPALTCPNRMSPRLRLRIDQRATVGTPPNLPPPTPRLARHESSLADCPPSSATHRRNPTCPRTTRPTPRTLRRNPSPACMPEPRITSTPPNRCHPSDGAKLVPPQTGATRQIALSETGVTHHSNSGRVQTGATQGIQTGANIQTGATRQLTSREL